MNLIKFIFLAIIIVFIWVVFSGGSDEEKMVTFCSESVQKELSQSSPIAINKSSMEYKNLKATKRKSLYFEFKGGDGVEYVTYCSQQDGGDVVVSTTSKYGGQKKLNGEDQVWDYYEVSGAKHAEVSSLRKDNNYRHLSIHISDIGHKNNFSIIAEDAEYYTGDGVCNVSINNVTTNSSEKYIFKTTRVAVIANEKDSTSIINMLKNSKVVEVYGECLPSGLNGSKFNVDGLSWRAL